MYGFTHPYLPPTNMSVAKQTTNIDWIMVPTVQQVEQISIIPGQKAWIMVQNEPIFALRSADGMGLVTTDYYRFEKIENAPSMAVDSLEKRVEALERMIGGQHESNN